MRTANPALNANVFAAVPYVETRMTINGTVNKAGILLILAVAEAGWIWRLFSISANFAPSTILLWSGSSGPGKWEASAPTQNSKSRQ